MKRNELFKVEKYDNENLSVRNIRLKVKCVIEELTDRWYLSIVFRIQINSLSKTNCFSPHSEGYHSIS
jgi:hypothetical protein